MRGLPDDESDAGIVRAILQMARALDMSVIAEGVETLEQLLYLKAMGCDECQGYFLARPCPADAFVRRVEQGFDTEAFAPRAYT